LDFSVFTVLHTHFSVCLALGLLHKFP
jgi:hypothetical protein